MMRQERKSTPTIGIKKPLKEMATKANSKVTTTITQGKTNPIEGVAPPNKGMKSGTRKNSIDREETLKRGSVRGAIKGITIGRRLRAISAEGILVATSGDPMISMISSTESMRRNFSGSKKSFSDSKRRHMRERRRREASQMSKLMKL
jgi:hypothetical protein